MIRTRIGQLLKIKDKNILADRKKLRRARVDKLTFKSKIFLMCLCPDSSKIKKKIYVLSSFDTLKRAFVGVHKVIQANDKGECEQGCVEEILRSTDRN